MPYEGRATLVGEFVEGTRPRFVTPAGELAASGRLRARRRGETFDPLPDAAAPDVPKTTRQEFPELPWTPKQVTEFDRWGVVRIAAAVFSAGLIFYDWFTKSELSGLEELGVLAFVVGIPWLLDDACRKVVVDRDHLRIRGLVGDRTRTLRFDGENDRPSSSRVAEVLETVHGRSSGLAHPGSVRLSWGAYALVAWAAGLVVGVYYVL